MHTSKVRAHPSTDFWKAAIYKARMRLPAISLTNASPKEGAVRSDLANQFIARQHYDNARREILRAIECREPLGHAAELWRTWNVLYNIETARNNTDAAKMARRKAIAAYEAYRRDGGVSPNDITELYEMVAQAVQSGETTTAEADFGLETDASRD
jgi:hypothetical protein